MRSFLALLVGAVALGGVAQAQTGSGSDPTGRGYVEGVAQSAFGNVTSQSFGVEAGVTILSNVEVFLEGGRVNDVAVAQIGAAAQTIGGYLSQTQANVTYTVKEPVTFGVLGAKYVVPTGKVRPYVLAGAGIAKVSRNVSFAVGGTDVTSNLAQAPYYVQLGSDLSGGFTKPMLVLGGGVLWPAWQRLVVDLHYRYGRIYADEGGINVNRVGVGIGVRF
jgi:opacity protein-like surface antigen